MMMAAHAATMASPGQERRPLAALAEDDNRRTMVPTPVAAPAARRGTSGRRLRAMHVRIAT